MKLITLIFSLIITTMTMAQNAPRSLDFWDGTFAYNRLIVKEHDFNGHTLSLELTGSTLEIGPKIEGIAPTWGPRDKVLVNVRKKDCDVDFINKSLNCLINSASGSITWSINGKLSKSLSTVLKDIKVEASGAQFGAQVKFSFSIEGDEWFTPANEELIFDFDTLNF
ncbi:MAG: hypothetical protein CME60_02305 [Halobacteriovoraceae bacterium]|nr:hypothetical protein [Halobacteriovoraceae bacterium]|tara:strand:- start:1157 stop:1657 length:501 start_codon:yes stop_codon:yes gene_type:complete